MTRISFDWYGEHFELMHQRALYLPRTNTLFIADPHFGKGASFRHQGLPVPAGSTGDDLNRLSECIKESGAQRLVILGDLFHDNASQEQKVIYSLHAFRERHGGLQIDLIRGNHDRRAGDPPPSLKIRCYDEPLLEERLAFCHVPQNFPETGVLCGHIHPGIKLRDGRRSKNRFPCFYFDQTTSILPAFGSFTGLQEISMAGEKKVFIIADNDIHPLFHGKQRYQFD